MQLESYMIGWHCQRFDAERVGSKEFVDMETTSEKRAMPAIKAIAGIKIHRRRIVYRI